MNEVIKKSWEEYNRLKVKVVELEAEIDRLRAILGEDGEYDYDECVEEFNRDLISMTRKGRFIENPPERVRITNTYGFKNE